MNPRPVATQAEVNEALAKILARPPAPRQLTDWYAAQPKGEYTCAWCGKVGPDHYVQPQHPFWAEGKTGVNGKPPARCCDCINAAIYAARAARKAQLAAEPRCEVTGCKRRGAWRSSGALLCGRHLKVAQASFHRASAGLGILGCLMEYDRNTVLAWASQKGTK